MAGSPLATIAAPHTAATLDAFVTMECHAVDFISWWQQLVPGVPQPFLNQRLRHGDRCPGTGVELNEPVVKEHLRKPGYFDPPRSGTTASWGAAPAGRGRISMWTAFGSTSGQRIAKDARGLAGRHRVSHCRTGTMEAIRLPRRDHPVSVRHAGAAKFQIPKLRHLAECVCSPLAGWFTLSMTLCVNYHSYREWPPPSPLAPSPPAWRSLRPGVTRSPAPALSATAGARIPGRSRTSSIRPRAKAEARWLSPPAPLSQAPCSSNRG